jgi:hypothetical protein
VALHKSNSPPPPKYLGDNVPSKRQARTRLRSNCRSPVHEHQSPAHCQRINKNKIETTIIFRNSLPPPGFPRQPNCCSEDTMACALTSLAQREHCWENSELRDLLSHGPSKVTIQTTVTIFMSRIHLKTTPWGRLSMKQREVKMCFQFEA